MTANRSALTAPRMFDGIGFHDNVCVVMADGVIEAVLPREGVPEGIGVTDLGGGILAPGFVDLQVNGGGGVMLNDGPSPELLAIIAQAHARLGATSILPTLITDTPDKTRAAIDATLTAIQAGIPGIAGLHLEGPHISVARKGAHDPDLIRPMESDDLELILAAATRLPVLMITVAPENVTPSQIQALTSGGVIVSLGHSDCSCDMAIEAARSGASCVTHLFNAMSQLTNREPGLVGAALTSSDLSAGLIADLVHVHPQTILAALRAKTGRAPVFLVSDAMATAGSQMDRFFLNRREIIRSRNRLTLADGTLAGADLDLATATGNLCRLGVDETTVLSMATSGPAAVAGIGDLAGSIRSGRTADLVHLDAGYTLQSVWRSGQRLGWP